MKHWVVGIVLAVVAFILLYASAATSQDAPYGSGWLLAGFALAAVGVFFVIAHASKHMTPNYRAPVNTAPGGPRAEISDSGMPNPWAGTGKTLGVMAVGLVGLLVYLGIYVGAWADIMGWLVWVGVALSFLMLAVVVWLTAAKVD